MGFQKTINLDPAIGMPGAEVNPGQAVYTAFNFVSDGTVRAGTFAFAKTLDSNGYPITKMNQASATSNSGAKVLGFVERNLIGNLISPLVEASDVYSAGLGLPIAIRGQFYANASGTAQAGQSVLCDPATGNVTYGAAGAANDTGWVVRFPRGVSEVAEGDLVIYENFGVSVAAASVVSSADETVGKARVGTSKVAA